MHILYSILYGLISGLTEFLPVSAKAHEELLMHLFGRSGPEPLRALLVHLGLAAAVVLGCRKLLGELRSQKRVASRSRARGKQILTQGLYDLRVVRTAAVPMILILLTATLAAGGLHAYLYLTLFLVINGIFLYIPEHIRQGNKEARHMTGLDSLLIGLMGGLSVFPGISRMGLCTSAAVLRGADKKNAVSWALLLSIPALIILSGFDAVAIFTGGMGASGWMEILGCVVSGLCAFGAGFGGVIAVRFLAVRTGFSAFAYYSWGAAFLSVILYLIT